MSWPPAGQHAQRLCAKYLAYSTDAFLDNSPHRISSFTAVFGLYELLITSRLMMSKLQDVALYLQLATLAPKLH